MRVRRRLPALVVIQPGELDVLDEHQRPRTRGDCLPGGVNEERPCPWASCKYHLAISVGQGRATVLEVEGWMDDGQPTCALDVADEGAISLDAAAALLGVTRQAVEQAENLGLARAEIRLRKEGVR